MNLIEDEKDEDLTYLTFANHKVTTQHPTFYEVRHRGVPVC